MIIKIRERQRGAHVKVTVFVGPDETRLANAGTLMFRATEWPTVAALLTCTGDVRREDCRDCPHTAHTGEECLCAVLDHDTRSAGFCHCGSVEDRRALRSVADIDEPFELHTAQALALVAHRADERVENACDAMADAHAERNPV